MLTDLLHRAAAARSTVFVGADGEVHNRTTTVGASESYSCLRKVWFDKHTPAPLSGWGYFARGPTCEEWLVGLLRQAIPEEWSLLYAGSDQVTLKLGRLSSTSDGLLVTPDEEIATELKSLDPRSNFASPKPQHLQQMQVQMGMYRELTRHQPERGLLLYMDASDYSHIVEHWVEYDPEVFAHARRRADLVFDTTAATHLAAEGALAGECRYCAHTEACGQAVLEGFPTEQAEELPPEGAEALTGLVIERQGVLDEIEDLKLEKGLLEERIKLVLREHNTRTAKGDGWSITYSRIAGRKALDTEALGKAIDLEPFYRSGKDSERLTIKVDRSE